MKMTRHNKITLLFLILFVLGLIVFIYTVSSAFSSSVHEVEKVIPLQ